MTQAEAQQDVDVVGDGAAVQPKTAGDGGVVGSAQDILFAIELAQPRAARPHPRSIRAGRQPRERGAMVGRGDGDGLGHVVGAAAVFHVRPRDQAAHPVAHEGEAA